MNREILFKAKRKDNGEWVEGYYVPHIVEGKIVHHFILTGETDLVETEDDELILKFYWEEIEPNTICQYTGLTDKNGNKIWENDIVVCKQCIDGNLVDYCVEIGYVEMKYGAFGLHRKQGYYRPFKDWLEDYEYEVIGNIFDNAELLEVE